MADELAARIADEIMAGALSPGVRLEEVALAARFGVSRTPVREALRHLEATGFVEKRPHRGVVVTNVDRARLEAMFEAMAELEASGARLAALRMTAAERRALQALHRASRALVRAGDHVGYEAFNADFHALIYSGAHNGAFGDVIRAMRRRVAPFRRAQFQLAGRLARSYAEHGRVVAAIVAGDPDAAMREMRDHLLLVSDASAQILQVRTGLEVRAGPGVMQSGAPSQRSKTDPRRD